MKDSYDEYRFCADPDFERMTDKILPWMWLGASAAATSRKGTAQAIRIEKPPHECIGDEKNDPNGKKAEKESA